MKPESLEKARAILEQGGLVVIPTETFYGIACDARSTEAVDHLVGIKGRDEGKPIPLIAGNVDVVKNLILSLPEKFQDLADRFWPGPLTMVLLSDEGFPKPVTAGTGTIGIRIPGPSFAFNLARTCSFPLTATSANRAGQQTPQTVKELDPLLIQSIDLIVDGGKTPGGEPSTLLDLTVDPPRILRPGALFEEVTGFLKKL
ncbi:threonylcarbamoyl-AMP synthase [bacterium]|nr:MAG: threonylcarbamoyl-AMP synthase [bacterium]